MHDLAEKILSDQDLDQDAVIRTVANRSYYALYPKLCALLDAYPVNWTPPAGKHMGTHVLLRERIKRIPETHQGMKKAAISKIVRNARTLHTQRCAADYDVCNELTRLDVYQDLDTSRRAAKQIDRLLTEASPEAA